MGTNFYLGIKDEIHIGKRSAAGLYCWDCKTTLCKGGVIGIHYGKSGFFDKCPYCGETYKPEPLGQSSVGVELGFAKTTSTHIGVTTVASFTWAINPSDLLNNPRAQIFDEYGYKYKISQFSEMLKQMCPIHYYDMIGCDFS